MKVLWLKLRSWFVSPIAVAICSSLYHDEDVWRFVEYENPVGCIVVHSSGRFFVTFQSQYVAVIRSGRDDHLVADLNRLDCFLIAIAAKSWVRRYTKQMLTVILSSLEGYKKV